MTRRRPRIVYTERGLVTPLWPIGARSSVGYARDGAPSSAPLLTRDEARHDARSRGAVAEFRRLP